MYFRIALGESVGQSGGVKDLRTENLQLILLKELQWF